MRRLIFLFIIINSVLTRAQNNSYYDEQNQAEKFYVVLSDTNSFDDLKKYMIEYSQNNQDKSFILFNAESLATEKIKENLNQILNTKNRFQKEYVYLIISGDFDFYKKNIALKSKIFASTLYLYIGTNYLLFDKVLTAKYPNNKESFSNTIALLKDDTWGVTVTEIERDNAIDLNADKQGVSVGIHIGGLMALDHNYETYVPDGFTIYGLHCTVPIIPKLQAKFQTDFGFKIPDVRSEVQSQLSSGDAEEEIEVKGYIFYNFALSAQYYPLNTKVVKPYLGVGIAHSNLMSFKSLIDPSEFSGGSGGSFNQSPFGDDENTTHYKSFEIPFSLGVNYKLTERIRLSLNSNLKIPFNSSSNNNGTNYLNYMSFNVGVSINFRKKDIFYQYIK